MPRNAKTVMTPGQRRTACREVALLLELAQFMRVTACILQSLRKPLSALWRRLVRTPAYRRVDGRDDAQDEPVWDAAGTLEANLERDLHEVTAYLRDAATKAEQAARRRAL